MSCTGRDPPQTARAAGTLAGLVAAGLMDRAEAAAALAAIPAPQADPSGWQARRAWALADAEAAWHARRRRAVRAIRAALAPLLAARAPRAALEEAAAGADRPPALLPAERARLLRAEVRRALQTDHLR